MNILLLLMVFFLIATVIKIATDNVANVLIVFKPFRNAKKYKLVIALLLTGFGVFGLNLGVFEALDVPLEVSRSWFHYFDMVTTTFFLTGGAQGIHKLNNAWTSYRRKEGNTDE